MSKAFENIQFIPIVRHSQASHLLLLSGLASTENDLSCDQITDLIERNKRSLAFSLDLVHLIEKNRSLSLGSVADRISLLLDPGDLFNHQETIENHLNLGGTVYFILSRRLLGSESRALDDLAQRYKKARFIFFENKKMWLSLFKENFSETFLNKLSLSYLPKLNTWDVLLDPLEVIESIAKNIREEKDNFPIVIFSSESLESSRSLERKFYLDPTKESYVKLSSNVFIRYLISGEAIASVFLKNLVRLYLFLFETLTKPRDLSRLKMILVRAYWTSYHAISESRVIGIKIIWFFRNSSFSFKEFLKFIFSRIFWNCYWVLTQTRGLLSLCFIKFFNMIALLGLCWRRLLWATWNSKFFWPMKKLYFFTEYQLNKRLLGRVKNED